MTYSRTVPIQPQTFSTPSSVVWKQQRSNKESLPLIIEENLNLDNEDFFGKLTKSSMLDLI